MRKTFDDDDENDENDDANAGRNYAQFLLS